jgi:hypothetical protein
VLYDRRMAGDLAGISGNREDLRLLQSPPETPP